MDTVGILRIMTDFGLVVLIWIVQIIIYPAFSFLSADRFGSWHAGYMKRVTFIVAPLMFLQLGIITLMLTQEASILNILSVTAAIVMWLHTFFFAVPVHNKLTRHGNNHELAQSLVKVNWFRTIGWSIIWLMGLYDFLG